MSPSNTVEEAANLLRERIRELDGERRPSQYFPDASEVVEVRFRRAL